MVCELRRTVRKVGSTHVEVFVCLLQRVVRIVSVPARVAVNVFVFAGGVEVCSPAVKHMDSAG